MEFLAGGFCCLHIKFINLKIVIVPSNSLLYVGIRKINVWTVCSNIRFMIMLIIQ